MSEAIGATCDVLVAAIDFGTTYSGAAMSFRHEYERDPTQIYAIKIGNPKASMKCMTCILIKSDGETCYKFGEDADSYFYEQLEESERKDWYFFKQFKMELYDANFNNMKDLQLTDVNGNKLPALRVFSLAILYIKDKVLEKCNERLNGVVWKDEITWVLTVPAIWDDRAKSFMRDAAEQAGIRRDKLVMALEPEAASIFCQHIPLVRDQPEISKLVPFKRGMKYVVLDCGGGTVDITVHEVSDRAIQNEVSSAYYTKEIAKARGNNMGGTTVDKAFVEYLKSLTGEDVFQKYQQLRPDDVWDLMHSFEEKKRTVKNDDSKITISTNVIDVFKDEKGKVLKDHIASKGNTDVTFPAQGKMRISNEAAKEFFNESISSIISKLSELFKQPEVTDISGILLVGGYSESPLLQERVREAFPLYNIISPREAGLAVLKGAVIFGHNPKAISERISRFTYGIELTGELFGKLVVVDDKLEVGKSNRVKTYTPPNPNDTYLDILIYVSPKPNPTYVTDEGCVKIMSKVFPMPDTTGGCDRPIKVEMVFGGTEFEVHVKNVNTGHEETYFASSWD